MDAIQSEYASRGVVVIAVDVGEEESIVRQYLQKNPRSCSVALDESNAVARRFGMDGVPHYVVIDRSGNIVARSSGAVGEQGMRNMLNRAEQSPPSRSSKTADCRPRTGAFRWRQQSANDDCFGRPRSFLPTKPIPKTIFILSNGEQLESDHYVIGGGFVDVTVAGDQRHIALAELDTKKTMALNRAHGVDLKLPTSKNEVFLGF